MAFNAHLNFVVSVLDDRSRQIGPAPILQGWSPTVAQRQKLTIPDAVWTQVTVPSGAKLMIFDLDGINGLRLNWETGATAADGIPLAGTTNALGLPFVFPLGNSPTVWLYNENAADVEFVAYFY